MSLCDAVDEYGKMYLWKKKWLQAHVLKVGL